MDATLIVIDNDVELARALALSRPLMGSEEAADFACFEAQTRLIAAYEESKWPRRVPSTAAIINYLMDLHGVTRGTRPYPRNPEPNK